MTQELFCLIVGIGLACWLRYVYILWDDPDVVDGVGWGLWLLTCLAMFFAGHSFVSYASHLPSMWGGR